MDWIGGNLEGKQQKACCKGARSACTTSQAHTVCEELVLRHGGSELFLAGAEWQALPFSRQLHTEHARVFREQYKAVTRGSC
jgi:hypothetical protein